MCGIGGVLKMGSKAIEASQITTLLMGLETRGREASGVVLENEGEDELLIHKAAISANNFVQTKGYEDFLKKNLTAKTKIALVHTRLHTVGVTSKNENNHPLSVGITAVVHNGSIPNHETLFKDMSLERGADTDSDIIRAITDKYGLEHKAVRELGRCSGSIASAVVDRRALGKVLILKSGNPVEMAMSDDFIIFASLRKPVDVAMTQWTLRHGVWQTVKPHGVGRPVFPPDTAWLLSTEPDSEGKKGKLWHQEFKTAPYTYEPYRGGYCGWGGGGNEDYSFFHLGRKARKKRIKALLASGEAEIRYVCPNSQCQKELYIPADLKVKPKDELQCTYCKASLNNAREVVRMVKGATVN